MSKRDRVKRKKNIEKNKKKPRQMSFLACLLIIFGFLLVFAMLIMIFVLTPFEWMFSLKQGLCFALKPQLRQQQLVMLTLLTNALNDAKIQFWPINDTLHQLHCNEQLSPQTTAIEFEFLAIDAVKLIGLEHTLKCAAQYRIKEYKTCYRFERSTTVTNFPYIALFPVQQHTHNLVPCLTTETGRNLPYDSQSFRNLRRKFTTVDIFPLRSFAYSKDDYLIQLWMPSNTEACLRQLYGDKHDRCKQHSIVLNDCSSQVLYNITQFFFSTHKHS